jgi:phosphoribosylpyrophosphate synthetase
VTQLTKLLQKRDADIDPNFYLADKTRLGAESVEFMSFAASNDFKDSLLIAPDDIMASGNTAIHPARAAKDAGAAKVYAYASHAVLTNGKDGRPAILQELDKPDSAIDGLMLTNTLNLHPDVVHHPRVWVLDASQFCALAVHNAFGVPYPGIEDDQGSLRGQNLGEGGVSLAQPVPEAFTRTLMNPAALAPA